MSRVHHVVLLICVGLISARQPFLARAGDPAPPALESLRNAAITATSATQARRAYRALFDAVGKKNLPLLKADSNTTIALQAAWECSELFHKDGNSRDFRRFLGFLEGRTGLQIPMDWELDVVCRSIPPADVDVKLNKQALDGYLPLCPALKWNEEMQFFKHNLDRDLEFTPHLFTRHPLDIHVLGPTSVTKQGDFVRVSSSKGECESRGTSGQKCEAATPIINSVRFVSFRSIRSWRSTTLPKILARSFA